MQWPQHHLIGMNNNMKKWWRKNPKLIGMLAYWLFGWLNRTLTVKVQKHPAIDPSKGYLFAFWHGKQLLPSFIMQEHHDSPKCALVSPSRDGALLTEYLRRCGFEVVRGSSRDSNVAALIKIKNKVLQGVSVGFGVDGPIGPIHVIKPGVIFVARKCNVPIIPIGIGFERAWTFEKAWDKFQVPKPFSRAGLVLGEPFVVTKDMDMDQALVELTNIMQQTERTALDLACSSK